MKKRKMNLKKLTLQKQTISNMETVQGGVSQTQIVVVCKTLVNTIVQTTTVATTYTDITKTIDLPPLISKDNKQTCITACLC